MTWHPSVIRNGGPRRTSTLKPVALSETDEKNDNNKNNNINESNSVLDKDSDDPSALQNNRDNNNNNCAKVQFNETVDIISIPSRHQFSNRIKNVYWSNRYELQENAERNILEYEYEGWDYHNVVLDEDMYVDTTTGALIHPCHLTIDESTGQTVIQSYDQVTEEEEPSLHKLLQQQQQQHQQKDDDEDDGFEYEDDDSYFRPLQRQSSVASSQ
jgi:hypothetical protein